MTKNTLAFWLYRSHVADALDYARDHVEFAKAGHQDGFSQFGEDKFLLSYFGDRKGIYIDIGGNHPFRLSNTYSLYRRGWSGLVVEPIFRMYAKHRRFRRRDIQVNAAAGNQQSELKFFEMVPAVLSTCDANEAEHLISSRRAMLFRTYLVPVLTVASLHRDYLGGKPVSLLSVDTEGHDVQVLEGVDWESMRPEVVICEANDEHAASEVSSLLCRHGYQRRAHLGCNLVFTCQ